MNEVYEFLKKCGTYFLATCDGDQPRVRPFGTIDVYDGKLTIQTGRKKDVSKQIHKNPKIKICAFSDGSWIRVAATATALDDRAAEEHMLEAYPQLRGMYAPGDGNNEIFALSDGTATICSFTAPPKTLTF